MLHSTDSLWPHCPLHTLSADLRFQKPNTGFNAVRVPCRKTWICSVCPCGTYSLWFLKPVTSVLGQCGLVWWSLKSAHLLIADDGRWCHLMGQFPNRMLIKINMKENVYMASISIHWWVLRSWLLKTQLFQPTTTVEPFLGTFRKIIITFWIYKELDPFWVWQCINSV